MGFSVNVTSYGQDGWKVVAVTTILIIMQFLMVTGRFVSRRLQKVSLAADDYVLLWSTIFTVGLCTLAIAFPRIAGDGSHIAVLQSTYPDSTTVGRFYIAWLILYGISVALAKCAILLLYIRVFTTCKRAFTITAYIVGFVIVATGLANTFVAILQCSPQSFAWDKSIEGGSCIDAVAWARYMAIPNVVTGAVMLVMPLPIVWRLNVNISAKIALTATFLHGVIGFIASCARLTILFSTNAPHLSNTTSLAWTIWTVNEPANYIIAACLPTLRAILTRILPPSFFIVSRKRPSKPYTSTPKVSWPRGSWMPRFRLETRNFQTSSRITGPWNGTTQGWEVDGGSGNWVDVEGGQSNVSCEPGRLDMKTLTSVKEEKKEAVETTKEVSSCEDL